MSGPILVFDIETDGRLWELTRVHCVVTQDLSTGEIRRFRRNDSENSIGEAWDHLCTASRLVAHNGVMFDAPALARALGRNLEDLPRVIDTLILSRLYWPDSKNHPLSKLHNMPNSLAAWGRYLGDHKSDSPDSWDRWTPYMEDYCEQDVRVTAKVYRWLASRMFKDWREAVSVEHSVAEIIRAQHLNGFCFDQAAAMRLVATLTAEKATVMDELQDLFPPEIEQMKTPEYWEYAGLRAPTKRELANLLADREIPKNRVRDAEPGPPRTREIPFNPGSTPHIVRRLGEKYGWKPTVFTENGNPKMDEKIIKKIPYPEARLIERILLLDKRLSQVDNWFTNLKDDGKIHGEVNTIGAVTSRMTHSSPNVSQVPRVSSPFGPECRRCWTARPGWWLVGADASGLELRMLAHELARWDGGEYAKIVTQGDIHSYHQSVIESDSRDDTKNFTYAYLYGASDRKLGKMMGGDERLGAELRRRMDTKVPGLGELHDWLRFRLSKGFVVGLDGRHVPIRHAHAALNTLLQSDGGILMKWALRRLVDTSVEDAGIRMGENYCFCVNSHDEWQAECPTRQDADAFGKHAVRSIEQAGLHLDVRCPLTGEYKIGRTWEDTH